jgi:predicted transcriptional regulator
MNRSRSVRSETAADDRRRLCEWQDEGIRAAIAEVDLGYVIEHEAVREWVK